MSLNNCLDCEKKGDMHSEKLYNLYNLYDLLIELLWCSLNNMKFSLWGCLIMSEKK